MRDRWESLRARLRPLPEGRCLVGLSGGADSVALLTMLHEIPGAEIEAVHINHGLRGAESDGDERFVRDLCKEMGVPLWARRVDLGSRRDENTAREARYAAYEQVLRERDIRCLVLAHQMDDQAETVMMRLLRGAGPEGLRGMRRSETRDGYIILRPMLDLSGSELRAALRERGISWREDRTNRETDYFRNRIRMQLLPQMEALAPGAAERLCHSAEMIGQDADALETDAEALVNASGGAGWIRTEPLEQAPEAVRSRALRIWWNRSGPLRKQRGLTYSQTRRLEALLGKNPGETENLPAGWRVRRRKDRLILLPPAETETEEERTGIPCEGREEETP